MYIAFLRGINVSGKNKINMKELVGKLEAAGFFSVKYYLNTGNLLFSVEDSGMTIGLENKIKEIIFTDFQLEIQVMVITAETLSKIIEGYPFKSADGKNMYVTLMKSRPNESLIEAVEAVKKSDDQYSVEEHILYLYVPTGYGKSKLTNNFIEKKGQVIATTRNLNTLNKLQKML